MADKAAGTIADELDAEGLTTRRGGRWRSSTITQLAHFPARVGLMPVHDRYGREGGERTGGLTLPLRLGPAPCLPADGPIGPQSFEARPLVAA
ncbi:recombinase family protein [Streptomyces sp. NPDC088729]|uniref:recombinase family protein n=1 Tax=Streptomyces sp. NPDC088729 TaxID=3365876 RepID=UPI000F559720